jgi:acetate kinase
MWRNDPGLNAGSSSIKFQLFGREGYEGSSGGRREAEGTGPSLISLPAKDGKSSSQDRGPGELARGRCLDRVLDWLTQEP